MIIADRVIRLELTCPGSFFPGSTFDRIEDSLDVAWREAKHPGGLVASLPPGWEAKAAANGSWEIRGPIEGLLVELRRAPPEPEPAQGDSYLFLGKRRRTTVTKEPPFRTLRIASAEWTVVARLRETIAEDHLATVRALLARVSMAR